MSLRKLVSLRAPTSLAAACLLALGTVTACGSSESQQAGEETLSASLIAGASTAPLYLGVEKGFFANEDIQFELQEGTGGAAILPAVTSGHVDIGYGNLVTLMRAQQRGLQVQVIAGSTFQVPPGSGEPTGKTNVATLVAEGSQIDSAKNLEGRTIAVNTLGAIEEVTVKYAIDQAGGDSATVNLVEIPTSQMPAALERGQVGAITAFEPYVTQAMNNGARILFHPFSLANHPAASSSVYFTSEEFVSDHPALIERFQAALRRSTEYAREHPTEVQELMPEITEISRNTAGRIAYPYWTTDVNVSSVMELAGISRDYGLLNRMPPLDTLLAPVEER